jgi:hypothetical protein
MSCTHVVFSSFSRIWTKGGLLQAPSSSTGQGGHRSWACCRLPVAGATSSLACWSHVQGPLALSHTHTTQRSKAELAARTRPSGVIPLCSRPALPRACQAMAEHLPRTRQDVAEGSHAPMRPRWRSPVLGGTAPARRQGCGKVARARPRGPAELLRPANEVMT